MSFALSNIAAQTRAVHVSQTRVQNHFRRRWVHNSLRKQAIMMPALSPFATEGTITRWKIKEGESFNPGDVLLQIENDAGICDVEACSPGIMGKILTPDGTDHVPVEAVIAIVARDATELASIQSESIAPTPPPFISTPAPPSATLSLSSSALASANSSPRHPEFKIPPMLSSPRTPRTPSLFEMHTMGYGHRSAHVGGFRGTPPVPKSASGLRLDLPPASPLPKIQNGAGTPGLDTPTTAQPPSSATYAYPRSNTTDEAQIDGAALRRMIVANLSASRSAAPNSEVELA